MQWGKRWAGTERMIAAMFGKIGAICGKTEWIAATTAAISVAIDAMLRKTAAICVTTCAMEITRMPGEIGATSVKTSAI